MIIPLECFPNVVLWVFKGIRFINEDDLDALSCVRTDSEHVIKNFVRALSIVPVFSLHFNGNTEVFNQEVNG